MSHARETLLGIVMPHPDSQNIKPHRSLAALAVEGPPFPPAKQSKIAEMRREEAQDGLLCFCLDSDSEALSNAVALSLTASHVPGACTTHYIPPP